MRLLLLGGTRFLGPQVVRHLVGAGHSVAVFHRGQTQTDLPRSVVHILGDRKALPSFAQEFKQFAPHVVIDLIAYTEQEALAVVQTVRGLSGRLVMLSSMDVYRAYDRLRRVDSSPANPLPLKEDAPLRQTLYPYRAQAQGQDNRLYQYEKILVERVASAQPDLPATILRLPCVYGPGDYQHRTFEYLKRMDDRRPAILLSDVRAGWRWTRGDVDNVAAAIALAATDERATGQVYNVGEPEVQNEAEWVRRIGQAAGWTGEILALPEEQLPGHLRTPLDWRHDIVGDTCKLRQELGYQEPVPLDKAMARTVVWERAHPPEPFDAKLFDYPAEDALLKKLQVG
jgi:nucleoside-diphosphate-sugar epimerase